MNPPSKVSAGSTAAWAVYLGMSWTWCIGMFLPVILVSRYGLPLFFSFAIPNVVGAAAMGWVLKKQGRSESLVENHHAACVTFSAVTIAFQVFFLAWMARCGVVPPVAAVTAVTGGIAGSLLLRRNTRVDLVAGLLVMAVSAVVLARALWTPTVGDAASTTDTIGAGLGLTPVCLLGFLTCPYLDLTFHRARQALPPHAARRAFGLGFGLIFASMIVLTLLYAGDFTGNGGSFGRSFKTWVTLQFCVQIAYTIAVHGRAARSYRKFDSLGWTTGATLCVVAVALIYNRPVEPPLGEPIPLGQVIYRLFMGLYGLVTPAYVWICVLPWRKAVRPTGWSLICWLIVIAAAGPFYWVGFVDERMIWLIPGVLVVLAGGPLRRLLPAGRELPSR